MPRQLLVLLWQSLNRQPQVIHLVMHRPEIGGCFQADAILGRLAGLFLDPLEHAVQCSPCEVSLRIWETLLIVRAGSLGDSQEPLALQVFHVQTFLPARAALNKIFGED